MRLIIALLLLLPIPGLAAAATLTPEEAVAFLLVGIQVGKHSEIAGMGFDWQESPPGVFAGTAKREGLAVDLAISVTAASDCAYVIATHVTVDSRPPYDARGTYDFSKITGISLTGPVTATIAGSDFCTSQDDGVCDAKVQLAVPTDQATLDAVYGDFRKETCK